MKKRETKRPAVCEISGPSCFRDPQRIPFPDSMTRIALDDTHLKIDSFRFVEKSKEQLEELVQGNLVWPGSTRLPTPPHLAPKRPYFLVYWNQGVRKSKYRRKGFIWKVFNSKDLTPQFPIWSGR
jgi:hypothetical protein